MKTPEELVENLIEENKQILEMSMRLCKTVSALVEELKEVRKGKCSCEVYNVGDIVGDNKGDIVVDKNCHTHGHLLK